MNFLDILICVWFVISTMGKVLLAGLLMCMVIGLCIDAWDFVVDHLRKSKEDRRG